MFDLFSGYSITQKIKFLHVREEETKKEMQKMKRNRNDRK